MINVSYDNNNISFSKLEDFYNWILKDKNYEKELIIDDKNANNLYSFFKFYISIKEECFSNLKEFNNTFLDESDNYYVKEATNELIRMNSDGKFLRAFLIALGYKTFSKNNDNKYLPLASAYETFQTAILIHDDIIDNANVRRGKTTIPNSYNNRFNEYNNTDTFIKRKKHISDSLGLCIGDLGFYLANKIILDNYKEDKELYRILDLYNKIVINTIKGEIIDVILPFNAQYGNTNTTIDDVMEIYKLKTAWYSIIGPFSLGMTLSGVDEDSISKIEKFLYNLGLAFQLKDDILGIFGDEKIIGKSALSDAIEFKQTILYAYLANNDKEKLKELNKYYGSESIKEEDLSKIKKIFEETGAYKYSVSVMEELFTNSREQLNKIDFIDEEYKNILNGFIEYLDLRTK